ncbi:MAG: SpoIIE family protein phosphatase [Nocardioides sp.]|nr:SpoIIE family protein phosphatase [Nocardioides sp.]
MTAPTDVPDGTGGPTSASDARVAAASRLAAASEHNTSLDRLCELAAALLQVASTQVSLISDVQVVAGGSGAGLELVGRATPAEDSLCTVTVGLGETLEVSEAPTDERVSHLPPVRGGAVGSYLGVPLVSAAGHVVGALCAYDEKPRSWDDSDVTTLERLAGSVVAELELAALSSDFETGQVAWRLAADAAGVGAFEWDLVSGDLRWDDQLLELFGLDRTSFSGTIEDFNAAVHPEDRLRVSEALESAVAEAGDYASEYRIRLPDGQTRWIAARGKALYGEDGTAVRLLGAAYDTTAVQEGEARIARVLESMPTAFFQLDHEWRFSYLNGEAEKLLGRSRAELSEAVIWDTFPAAVGSDFEHYYRLAVETDEPVSFDAFYPAPLEGWYEVRGWPNPDGLAVYFVEVTARREAQDQVASNARRSAMLAHVTEQLTGTLETREAVARLGALVVPELGDWCIATLVSEQGHEGRLPMLQDVGGWHRDPQAEPLVERFAEIRLQHLGDSSFLPGLMASSQPLVAAGATELLCAIFDDDETRDLVTRLAPEHAAVVMLRGRERVVGMLTVLRGQDRETFTPEDLDTLAEVAARAGLALDNARLFAEQRDLAEGLQRSLLTAPPQPDHLHIEVRYESAAETAQVGGDWYDSFLQDDGNTVLVIGDVVGHDTAAAAAMGQVRNLLRGIAVFSGLGPADVLRGVDRALETLQVDTTATAVVARLEQTPAEVARGITRLRFSNAGHPPPVLLAPDGSVRLLDNDEPDLLLGLNPHVERTEQVVVLERGSTVLLFTDGLVERRGEDLDTGLERLGRELQRLGASGPDLGQLTDRLLARLVPSRREDDVALVAVHLYPQDRPRPAEAGEPQLPASVDPHAPGAKGRIVRARFGADPASVPGVRAFVRDALEARGSGLVEDAELCVSELAANAALHSGGPFMEVSVRLDPDAVTITIADEGDVPLEAVSPRMAVQEDRAPDDEATTGRGLGIVSVLASEWGVERTPTGKRVWARLVEGHAEQAVRPPDSAPTPSSQGPSTKAVPDGWGLVRLLGAPVDLMVRQDQHLDELVRELQLLEADQDNQRSRDLAAELGDLLGGPAHARHLGRRTAQEAADAGLVEVDMEMVLPHDAAPVMQRVQEVVAAADRLCEQELLLTLHTSADVRALRAWMTDQIVGQLLEGRPAEPWETWLRRTRRA